MLHYTNALVAKSGERIGKVRNILQHRTAISLLSIFITGVAIFLMTGALYFRNEVVITDGSNTYRVFTMQTTPEGILSEQGITLSGMDFYSYGNLDGGNNSKSSAALSITRSHSVRISADGVSFFTEAFAGETVGEILERENVKVNPYDIVTPALHEIIEGAQAIIIQRSFDITLNVDGVTMTLPASPDGSATVADVLSHRGIVLNSDEVFTQNLNAYVYPGMEATISTIRYVEREEFFELPFQTMEIPSNLLEIGAVQVVVEGVPGKKRVVIREKVVDGVVVDETLILTEILSEPVTQVQNVGMALATPYSLRDFDEIVLVDGLPVNYEYLISGKATAYTAASLSGTASGRELQIGTVAVNPRVIPYGSLVYIVTRDGSKVYGAAIAADTGGFIHDTDIVVDVFKGTHDNIEAAYEWGLRNVDVYVINTGVY
ncbi:MAG: ubiquitin-like domain-containing protein [Oscillospiraceae bacterium]|nr:ubiquitin-like domain-containing protein [Oscillospiraceae bacterium]